jgi:hypothetical protein
MQDTTDYVTFEPWHMGKEWQKERLQIGGEYISWPQHQELREIRGRRCVFLGFVPVPYGEGTEAKVSFPDDDRVEFLSPEELIAAWLVGRPQKSGGKRSSR